MKQKSEWKRNCPKCGKELFYSTKYTKNRAEKLNANCYSCAKKGKKLKSFTDETKKKSEWKRNCPECGEEIYYSIKGGKVNAEKLNANCYSCATKGKNNPMYGKIGENNPNFGKKRSEDEKLKMRLSMKKRIEDRYGQISPNYNPKTIPIIKEYEKKHEFNFQHAENGGEVCIDGYFPDGVDQQKMTIIEIDEKHHFNSDGKLRQKDIKRQKYLEGLGYKFIRIKI